MRRSPLRLLALLLLTTLPAPTAGAAARKLIWGPNELADGTPAFPIYEELGVDELELQVQWSNVAQRPPADARNPDDPAYEWPANVDEAVDQAGRSGMRVMLMLKTTPGWANRGRGPGYAPTSDADYADFAIAAARRYRSVRDWMIWGEPQRAGSFEPMPANKSSGPRRYARLLDAAYAALKSESRHNKVIGGNTWSAGTIFPKAFLRRMRLPNGKPPRLDYFGHNPFSARFPRLSKPTYYAGLRDMSDVDTFSREVRKVYKRIRRRPKLWLSEFTVPSAPNDIFSFSVSPEQQARWLTAAFRIAHRYKPIAAIGWFRLQDDPSLPAGLLTETGAEKPSFEAYKRAR